MKVKELVQELQNCNQESNIEIIYYDQDQRGKVFLVDLVSEDEKNKCVIIEVT